MDNTKYTNTTVNLDETESQFTPDDTILNESVALANKLKAEQERLNALEEAPLNNVQLDLQPDNAIVKEVALNVTADLRNVCSELNTTKTRFVEPIHMQSSNQTTK